jgi:hypothetical protein
VSYRNLNLISEACQNNHTDDKKVIDKLLRIFENIFEHICPRVVEKTRTNSLLLKRLLLFHNALCDWNRP